MLLNRNLNRFKRNLLFRSHVKCSELISSQSPSFWRRITCPSNASRLMSCHDVMTVPPSLHLAWPSLWTVHSSGTCRLLDQIPTNLSGQCCNAWVLAEVSCLRILARSRTFEAAVPPCFWKCWWFFSPCYENSPIFVSACFKAVSSAGDAAGIPFRRSRSSAMNFNCPAWQDLQFLEPWPWSNRSLRSGQSRVPGMSRSTSIVLQLQFLAALLSQRWISMLSESLPVFIQQMPVAVPCVAGVCKAWCNIQQSVQRRYCSLLCIKDITTAAVSLLQVCPPQNFPSLQNCEAQLATCQRYSHRVVSLVALKSSIPCLACVMAWDPTGNNPNGTQKTTSPSSHRPTLVKRPVLA